MENFNVLLKLMKECNRFYIYTKESNDFTIMENEINVTNKYLINQYIILQGSILNNGIYKIIASENNKITVTPTMQNEHFSGELYGLNIAPSFLELSNKIDEYQTKNKQTNLRSESFGGYSVSWATGKNGAVAGWKDVFKDDIKDFWQFFADLDFK